MATTLPQALDALAKATDRLAQGDPHALKVNLALAIGTFLTALFTLILAIFTYRAAKEAARSAKASEDMVRLEREREERHAEEKQRQRDEERGQLAGALAAELRGLIGLWRQLGGEPYTSSGALLCRAEEHYFPVFDSCGPKLLLLPYRLAEEVVTGYCGCKQVLEGFRLASYWTEQMIGVPGSPKSLENRGAAKAKDVMAGVSEQIVFLEKDLLPKLDAVAEGRGTERSTTSAGTA